jgi:hypothetical protein
MPSGGIRTHIILFIQYWAFDIVQRWFTFIHRGLLTFLHTYESETECLGSRSKYYSACGHCQLTDGLDINAEQRVRRTEQKHVGEQNMELRWFTLTRRGFIAHGYNFPAYESESKYKWAVDLNIN